VLRRHAAGSIELAADFWTVVVSGMLKPRKITTIALVLSFLGPCAAVFSQQSNSVASELVEFKSRDVASRIAAYEKIKETSKLCSVRI